jgi:IS1 family transposase
VLVLVAGMIPSPGEAPYIGGRIRDTSRKHASRTKTHRHHLPRRSARADDRGAGEAAGPDRRRTRHCCIGGQSARQRDSGHEISPIRSPPAGAEFGLRRIPVPARGHHPCGPLVATVRSFPPGGRGAPRRTRHRSRSREHLPVGPAVRAGVRRAARARRHVAGDRWHVDETYVKVSGTWRYLFRAIDQFGQVVDVFLSPRRDTKAARRFFAQAIDRTRISPVEVTTDRYRVYTRVLDSCSRRPSMTPRSMPTTPSRPTTEAARLRPMRGLKRDGTARVIVAAHAFVRNHPLPSRALLL